MGDLAAAYLIQHRDDATKNVLIKVKIIYEGSRDIRVQILISEGKDYGTFAEDINLNDQHNANGEKGVTQNEDWQLQPTKKNLNWLIPNGRPSRITYTREQILALRNYPMSEIPTFNIPPAIRAGHNVMSLNRAAEGMLRMPFDPYWEYFRNHEFYAYRQGRFLPPPRYWEPISYGHSRRPPMNSRTFYRSNKR